MDIRDTYYAVMELQTQLYTEVLDDAEKERQYTAHVQSDPDYRKIKALAATYELQDYLAAAIADAVESGELDPAPEDTCEICDTCVHDSKCSEIGGRQQGRGYGAYCRSPWDKPYYQRRSDIK